MMNTFLLATSILTLVMADASMLTGGRIQARIVNLDPLETLTYKTGWIPLGDLTADSKNWAAGSDPTVPYRTGSFEILGKKVDRRKPVLPKVGDRIRITARVPIIILDYTKTGEERRLDPPVTRGLGSVDNTNLWIETGAIVEVRAVKISPLYGQARIVWARVSPAKN
jgi:hypothetical protein